MVDTKSCACVRKRGYVSENPENPDHQGLSVCPGVLMVDTKSCVCQRIQTTQGWTPKLAWTKRETPDPKSHGSGAISGRSRQIIPTLSPPAPRLARSRLQIKSAKVRRTVRQIRPGGDQRHLLRWSPRHRHVVRRPPPPAPPLPRLHVHVGHGGGVLGVLPCCLLNLPSSTFRWRLRA